MSITWPISLIPEVAERRCVIVLGAGASAGSIGRDGATKPPAWPSLLDRAKALVPDNAEKQLVNDLVGKERFLDAAEIVVARANPADYGAFIRQTFVDPQFQHSTIHEQIYKLDPK